MSHVEQGFLQGLWCNIAECVFELYHGDTSNKSPTPYMESSGAEFEGMSGLGAFGATIV